MSQEAKERSAKALGDQAWWEQYGFKGAISEDKKRDYGNGVPKWSPYHRMDEKDIDLPPSGLPADAFWFQQWGFRTASLSEEAQKCQGYGVPMWSPYFKTKEEEDSARTLSNTQRNRNARRL